MDKQSAHINCTCFQPQVKVCINPSHAALTQMLECVLLAVMSIKPHHSLSMLPGLMQSYKHRGWGRDSSFTSLWRTSKSLLLTGQMNAPCLPSWCTAAVAFVLLLYASNWGPIMEPEMGHLLVLAISPSPGFISGRRTLILLIKHVVASFSFVAISVCY